jgi:hypothetical protein
MQLLFTTIIVILRSAKRDEGSPESWAVPAPAQTKDQHNKEGDPSAAAGLLRTDPFRSGLRMTARLSS